MPLFSRKKKSAHAEQLAGSSAQVSPASSERHSNFNPLRNNDPESNPTLRANGGLQAGLSYPWSQQPLRVSTEHGVQVAPSSILRSPFPRYGHAVPPKATSSGELPLFGGLVGETLRNDFYLISADDLTAEFVRTTGEIPSPRVGHASVLVGNVLVVWGGDTEPLYGEKLDEELYVLDLASREWTRVAVQGPSPCGRYGHTVTVSGSKIFLFGGQAGERFFDDMWTLDLDSSRATHSWELVENNGATRPSKRTNHTCVHHETRIILFGGTDFQHHCNDTWAFDTLTRTWSELSCTGFIPSPREGHSVAVVDDVLYVFGGRGAAGQDLGDLVAFKLSQKRWYMCPDMGPAPSPVSGHAMASVASRILVLGGLGGEIASRQKGKDADVVHVLDTKEYWRYLYWVHGLDK